MSRDIRRAVGFGIAILAGIGLLAKQDSARKNSDSPPVNLPSGTGIDDRMAATPPTTGSGAHALSQRDPSGAPDAPPVQQLLEELSTQANGALHDHGRPKIVDYRKPYLRVQWEIDGVPVEHSEMMFEWNGTTVPSLLAGRIPDLASTGTPPAFPREAESAAHDAVLETLNREGQRPQEVVADGFSWAIRTNDGAPSLLPLFHYVAVFRDAREQVRTESFSISDEGKVVRRANFARH